jgi:hypothetical protein|eukprot:6920280-Prymnesium_polylepis.1
MERLLSLLAPHAQTRPLAMANKILCVFPVVKDKPETLLGRWRHVNRGITSGFTHDPGYEGPLLPNKEDAVVGRSSPLSLGSNKKLRVD